MLESTLTERQLIAHFVDALRELPEVEAELHQREPVGKHDDRGYDAQVDLHVAGKSFVLLLEAKKAVFPRDVRQVIWPLRAASHERPPGYGDKPWWLLVAESISPGAKELLRRERVGYYDSGGSLYLPAPGAYLYIDKPPPKALTKSVRTLFTGRRAQVLHALLVQHQSWFGVTELAQQAMVSPATASQVLSALERFDWLEARGQGPSKERYLREPAALLDAWAKQLATIRPPPLRRYYVPGTKADTVAARLSQVLDAHDVPYAISHEAAAQRYAPFLSNVSQVRVRVLIDANADAAIGDLGARVVNEGANLGVIEAKSSGELLFRERVDDRWLASPIQIYLDLLRGEGRSKEMAEHFRKERIGF
jgi:DNA-binding transcriptional ArsR family regulator